MQTDRSLSPLGININALERRAMMRVSNAGQSSQSVRDVLSHVSGALRKEAVYLALNGADESSVENVLYCASFLGNLTLE